MVVKVVGPPLIKLSGSALDAGNSKRLSSGKQFVKYKYPPSKGTKNFHLKPNSLILYVFDLDLDSNGIMVINVQNRTPLSKTTRGDCVTNRKTDLSKKIASDDVHSFSCSLCSNRQK